MIGHGLGPYFQQQTIDDILTSCNTYYIIHFDETTNIQVKNQMDVLVRYYSEKHGELKVKH